MPIEIASNTTHPLPLSVTGAGEGEFSQQITVYLDIDDTLIERTVALTGQCVGQGPESKSDD